MYKKLQQLIGNYPLIRAGLFVAAGISGAAVLAEVYGIARLHDVVWYGAFPVYAVLLAIAIVNWKTGLSDIADAIAIGAVGGFVGTIVYDVVRLPFLVSGYRIFAQNSTYGLWILDSDFSTRFSQDAGWFYHFANGTLFGVMYALLMRGRAWWFGILWAFFLETVALVSPYGHIYHITQSLLLTIVAYYGHVGYGLPLGILVQKWDWSQKVLRGTSKVTRIAVGLLLAAAITGPLFDPAAIHADDAVRPGEFRIKDQRLTPDWQRLNATGPVSVINSCDGPANLILDTKPFATVAPCQTITVPLNVPGVHQIAVKGPAPRTHSSFVLVDPVSKAP